MIEKKEKSILTENRLVTINKRETSFEGLVSQLENGEDGIYNLINDNKNQIFQPKVTITKKDLEEIPVLRQLRDAIEYWEQRLKVSEGREAFIIKSTIIELRKDQYVLKNAYKKPIVATKITRSRHDIPLEDDFDFDDLDCDECDCAYGCEDAPEEPSEGVALPEASPVDNAGMPSITVTPPDLQAADAEGEDDVPGEA